MIFKKNSLYLSSGSQTNQTQIKLNQIQSSQIKSSEHVQDNDAYDNDAGTERWQIINTWRLQGYEIQLIGGEVLSACEFESNWWESQVWRF